VAGGPFDAVTSQLGVMFFDVRSPPPPTSVGIIES